MCCVRHDLLLLGLVAEAQGAQRSSRILDQAAVLRNHPIWHHATRVELIEVEPRRPLGDHLVAGLAQELSDVLHNYIIIYIRLAQRSVVNLCLF